MHLQKTNIADPGNAAVFPAPRSVWFSLTIAATDTAEDSGGEVYPFGKAALTLPDITKGRVCRRIRLFRPGAQVGLQELTPSSVLNNSLAQHVA